MSTNRLQTRRTPHKFLTRHPSIHGPALTLAVVQTVPSEVTIVWALESLLTNFGGILAFQRNPPTAHFDDFPVTLARDPVFVLPKVFVNVVGQPIRSTFMVEAGSVVSIMVLEFKLKMHLPRCSYKLICFQRIQKRTHIAENSYRICKYN
jgi:hypothetical protein